jgi:hypothetical protein
MDTAFVAPGQCAPPPRAVWYAANTSSVKQAIKPGDVHSGQFDSFFDIHNLFIDAGPYSNSI